MRAVFDTGVVLSALLFPHGRLRWLVSAWSRQRPQALVNTETCAELIRALAYPKFHLDEDEIEVLLAEYLPHAEVVEMAGGPLPSLPRCRDADDQVVLELATAGRADALITGDRDLLDLAGQTPFRILTPADLRRSLRDPG